MNKEELRKENEIKKEKLKNQEEIDAVQKAFLEFGEHLKRTIDEIEKFWIAGGSVG
jgi:hypothetical protein